MLVGFLVCLLGFLQRLTSPKSSVEKRGMQQISQILRSKECVLLAEYDC